MDTKAHLTRQFAKAGIPLQLTDAAFVRGLQGARDITVNNGVFAVAFAVDTAPPWGVARGGIVDIALVDGDSVGFDIASLADFLPNTWTNWSSSYQRVTVVEHTAEEVLIEVERDWGAVELRTSYWIRSNDSLIHTVTEMRNTGDDALGTIKSGYVVWPDGGTMFGIPGLYGVNASSEESALADWTAAYGEDWVLALHAPYATIVEYDGQDRSIDVRISRIRPKVGDDPDNPRRIKTVRSKGYLFVADVNQG